MGDSSESQGDIVTGMAGDDLDSELSNDLRARVKGELEPGERLLWADRSRPPQVSPAAGYFIASMIALLLLIGGVLVIAYAMGDFRARANRESPMPFGIILCVASGVTMLGTLAQWISTSHDRRRRTGVYYAVTDRRAIIWIPEPKSDAVRVIPLPKGQIDYVLRVERPDGSGTLELHSSTAGGRFPWYPFGFQHIPEVRRVEQIVRNNLITGREKPPRSTVVNLDEIDEVEKFI